MSDKSPSADAAALVEGQVAKAPEKAGEPLHPPSEHSAPKATGSGDSALGARPLLASTPRRLLEDDAPIAPAESTQQWFSAGAEGRLEALVRVVTKRPKRPPFSQATQKTAEALCAHLTTQLPNANVSLTPMASSLPSRPPAFWFLVFGAGLLLLSPIQPALGLILAGLLAVGGCCELLGVWRFSQLFFSPRGGYLVEASGPATAQVRPELLLWAALDTPPADVVYHPRPFRKFLSPLYQYRAMPGLLVAGSLVVMFLLLWWSLVASGNAAGRFCVLWGVLMGLGAAALGWFYQPTEESGAEAGAVAVAVEAFQRLQKLNLPYDIRLILVGASQTHVGIESWFRQQNMEMRQGEALLCCVMPLGRTNVPLAYASHRGLVWPFAVPVELGRLGDWTSARLTTLAGERAKDKDTAATFIPKIKAQRFYGSTPAMWARRFGADALIIGDDPTAVEDDAPQLASALASEHDARVDLGSALSLEALDAAAAYLVAFAQARAHEQDASGDSH